MKIYVLSFCLCASKVCVSPPFCVGTPVCGCCQSSCFLWCLCLSSHLVPRLERVKLLTFAFRMAVAQPLACSQALVALRQLHQLVLHLLLRLFLPLQLGPLTSWLARIKMELAQGKNRNYLEREEIKYRTTCRI